MSFSAYLQYISQIAPVTFSEYTVHWPLTMVLTTQSFSATFVSVVHNCNLIVQTCCASPTEYCGKPEGAGKQIQILDQELERYENGNQIDYTCINPHKGPGGTATCNNGEWHMPIECKGKPYIYKYVYCIIMVLYHSTVLYYHGTVSL